MSSLAFALQSIRAHGGRSVAVALCVGLVVGFSFLSTLVLRGSEYSLRLGLERLGADLVVVPKGAEGRVETALLMGKPTTAWLPSNALATVARTPGVAAASPQLFLASLANASCCAVSEMFLIAYDPATDFTVRPWLEHALGKPLALGEAVGGSYVFLPAGDDYLKVYGYPLSLMGSLEATGTGLDQTLFFTFATAREMARLSPTQAERPLVIPPDAVSAVLVKVEAGGDVHAVATSIAQAVPEASALESPVLFQTYVRQLSALTQAFAVILVSVWFLVLGLLGLIFSLAANRRRRELAVLRALGGSAGLVFASLLAEAALLAMAGAVPGIALASLAALLFRGLIVVSLGVPFLFPATGEYLLLAAATLGLAGVATGIAALWPALRAGREEPATAMR